MRNLNKLLFWSYAALVFFVPLVFTPWNFELFEFNKMILVYFFTIVIGSIWIIKMTLHKKVIFRRTFWDIPLILFLVSQIISTILSIDPHTSIFGYYSRFNGGLLSIICYLILYWSLVANLNKAQARKLINLSLASGILVSLYGIAQHFGIDKDYWVQDVQRRIFSTLGQPNWLAAYLNILIFLTLTRNTSEESSSNTIRGVSPGPIFYLLFSIFYTTLLFTKSRSGFLGFVIPFAIWTIFNAGTILGSSLPEKTKKLKNTGLTIIITIILSVIIGLPFSIKDKLNISFLSDVNNRDTSEVKSADTSEVIPNITPSSNIRKIVWQGAVKLWKENPIVGTGVETFGYSYYWVRPKAHNLTSEWNFLYNKAHNEFLNYAATTGTLGLIAYLLLPISFFIYILKNKNLSLCTLHFAFLTILITNFFGFSVVTTSLFFFLLPGIVNLIQLKTVPGAKIIHAPGTNCRRIKIKQWLILISTALAATALLTAVGRYWLADFHYAKGEKYSEANLVATAEKHLKTAIKLNPLEPNYYSELGIAQAKTAAYYIQNDQPEEGEKYIQPAIDNSVRALEISPYHLNFYKNYTQAHYYLAVHDLNLLENAIEALNQAQQLAPTDPKIPFSLAQIYQTLDNDEKAKEYYQAALELKPNYNKAESAIEKL